MLGFNNTKYNSLYHDYMDLNIAYQYLQERVEILEQKKLDYEDLSIAYDYCQQERTALPEMDVEIPTDTKKCDCCKVVKDIKRFKRSNSYTTVKGEKRLYISERRICSSCSSKQSREKRKNREILANRKKCKKCNQVKDLSKFTQMKSCTTKEGDKKSYISEKSICSHCQLKLRKEKK